MAKEIVNPVPYRMGIGNWQEEEQQYNEQCANYLTDAGYFGEGVGKVIKFPMADNYARYMVASINPPVIMHLNFGDGYAVHSAMVRGLDASDITAELNREAKLRELFANR